jgi:hypothetical protein
MMEKVFLAGWVAVLGSLAGCGGSDDRAQAVGWNGQNITIEECTGRNATAAAAGRAGGISLAKQAWATVNDCNLLATFEQVLREDEALLTCQGSDYVVCRCLGMKAGMEDELLELEVACSVGVCSAPAPSVCTDTSTDLQQYQAGVAVGASLAAQAWKGCDQVAAYQQAIASALAILVPPPGASQPLVCRVTGSVDGMTAKANALVSACP